MPTEVVMPEMGEGMIEGQVVEWLKQVGDPVTKGDPLLEIETDKVTVEVEAETNGTLLDILVEPGETAAVGTVLAVIGKDSEAPPQKTSQGEKKPTKQRVLETASSSQGSNGSRISPLARRIAEEHHIDVNQVPGSGRQGLITKRDILAYLEHTAPVQEEQVQGKDTSQNLIPLTQTRRSIAEHMVRSVQTSPHVTTIFEFDFSTVADHRTAHKEQFQKQGIHLTYLAYLAYFTVQALQEHPKVNASWHEDGILTKQEVHLGIAAATPRGLVVPVIHHANDLNLRGLARAINELGHLARTNQLTPKDVQGGTFSITNHGASGSLIGTPIINQPQVGILGMGLIENRVKVLDGSSISIRPCAYISFSFDHRVLDGAEADAFVKDIKDQLESHSITL